MNPRGNYQFDIAEWMPRFSPTSSSSVDDEVYYGAHITSPSQLCHNIHLRQMLAGHVEWGHAVPVDVFVMAEGEPESRHNTKIGGLPYRPRSVPWPKSSKYKLNAPATFLAQFCFSDSKDITGDLPGDVLLVYTDSDESWPDDYMFEWFPLGLTDLMRANDVPEQAWNFKPCYGHICRIDTFPNARVTSPVERRGMWLNLGGGEFIDVHGGSFAAICESSGTNIGPGYSRAQLNDPLPGRPLCEFASVIPHPNGKFPWVNRETPLSSNPDFLKAWMDFERTNTYFGFGDGGSIHVSIDDKGHAHATLASG